MTRTTKNRVARDSAPRETLDGYICNRALRAEANYQDTKDAFTEAFAENPSYAIEWYAEKMVETQTRHLWWQRVRAVAERDGGQAAIEAGREDADRQVECFFGGNSTCPWHNAMRRAEAETYHDLLRRAVPELEAIAREGAR